MQHTIYFHEEAGAPWHELDLRFRNQMRANHCTVTVNHKNIVAVADPHLESVPEDVAHMIQFIGTLEPKDHALVFLGDLFHVWTESHLYHSQAQKNIMGALRAFRALGGLVFLTAGNRDLFFSDSVSTSGDNRLSFDAVSREFIHLYMGNGLIVAGHGDTVNSEDKAYLRWRRIVGSSWVKKIFSLIPAEKGKMIISALEKQIKRTNRRFRIHFPHGNWSRFVKDCSQRYAPGLVLVGHFHPKQPLITQQGATTGIVVPSWHPSRAYLVIDAQLGYQIKRYNP